ncbi:MAG: hypothetical protein EPO36_14090 [Chloroflexota bacterium]|nr:MAG: hypothetical protein EPO36_14090 [Chloroflexota bacterium]
MRRLISLVSILVALVALALVLYNATLVDRRAPSVVQVSLSAPAGDDRIAQTITAIDIEFSEPVDPATVEARFSIEPYVAGSFAWDGTTAIFTPSAKLPGDTEFSVQIEAGYADLVGNIADLPLEPWIFRTVGPPAVVAVVPGDGVTGVAVDSVVDIEFDRLMDTASVEAAIRLDPPVPFRASWSGESVRLLFDTPFRFGTTYTLTLGAGAADTGGNRLREPLVVHFSTVAAALSATEIVPADRSSGVGVRTPVAIRFDAPIDPDTARAAFRITPSVGGDVRIVSIADDLAPSGGSPSEGEADTILFVPDAPLAPHTTYAVTLEPIVARRDDPAAVAAGRSWTFTTGSPTSSGQNHVAFLSARSGVRNVWLMNPDGTSPHQLTTELVPVSGFDATGDGSLVAYSAGGIVSLIGIDGEGVVRLTDDGLFEYAPVFTPDDGSLIVGRRDAADSDLGYWLVPLPDTPGEARQLVERGAPPVGSAALGGDGIGTTDGLPAWMPRSAIDPTGATALIVTASGEPILVNLSLDTAGTPPIAVELLADAAAAWSPRHGAFVVAAAPTRAGAVTAGTSLWTIEASGAAAEIPGTGGAVGPVGVGPDGGIAVTVRGAAGRAAGIGVLPFDSTALTRYDAANGFDDRWPAFSPDSATLLIGRTSFMRPEDADERPPAANGIWALDRGSGIARQLSTDGVYARWLP